VWTAFAWSRKTAALLTHLDARARLTAITWSTTKPAIFSPSLIPLYLLRLLRQYGEFLKRVFQRPLFRINPVKVCIDQTAIARWIDSLNHPKIAFGVVKYGWLGGYLFHANTPTGADANGRHKARVALVAFRRGSGDAGFSRDVNITEGNCGRRASN
jgi:hypothetical protein